MYLLCILLLEDKDDLCGYNAVISMSDLKIAINSNLCRELKHMCSHRLSVNRCASELITDPKTHDTKDCLDSWIDFSDAVRDYNYNKVFPSFLPP